MAFPTSPTDGQEYNNYIYDESLDLWRKIQPASADHLHDSRYYTEGEVDTQWTNHGSGSNNDVNTSGSTIIDKVYTDDSGHITSIGTRTFDTGEVSHFDKVSGATKYDDWSATLPTISVGTTAALIVSHNTSNGGSSNSVTIYLPSSGTYGYSVFGDKTNGSASSVSGSSLIASWSDDDGQSGQALFIYTRLS